MVDRATPGSVVTPLEPAQVFGASGRGVAQFANDPAFRWFGPNNPMRPQAPPEVAGRILDYPVGYNLAQRPRAYEAISFDTLRNLAESWDLLRLLIETRKDQLAKMPWAIVPSKKKYGLGKAKPTDVILAACDTVAAFFEQPDPEYGWVDWLRALMEDLFVLDAPTLFVRRERGGKLFALQPLDGATVKRVIDPWGRTPSPPEPAYQQILKGLPAVNYTTNDLLYRPRNRRANRVYGYGPVEQILVTINIALRRQLWQTQYYSEGNIPEALIGVPDTWTPEQISTFQTYWDSILEGNTAQRRHAKFIPGGMARTYVATKEPELKNLFDEWCARIACFNFSMSPAPFVSTMNRATAESLKEAALEEGLIPLQNWVKDLVDFATKRILLIPDVEFAWQADEDVDVAIEAGIVREDAKAGLISIDEGRARRGWEPYSNGAGADPMVLTANGYVPLDPEVRQQAAMDLAEANKPEPGATVPGQLANESPKKGSGPKVEKRVVGLHAPGLNEKARKAKRTIAARYAAALARARVNTIAMLRSTLSKGFSDQPRDDHGMWTAGGGGSILTISDRDTGDYEVSFKAATEKALSRGGDPVKIGANAANMAQKLDSSRKGSGLKFAKSNPNHEPSGSPEGGQFASGGGSEGGVDAVSKYVEFSQHLNDSLRGGGSLRASDRVLVHELDAMIRSSPIANDMLLFRSAPESIFGTMKPGDVFVDKGFVSTTEAEATADLFARNNAAEGFPDIRIQIQAPKGTFGLRIDDVLERSAEHEILLGRNTQFYVISNHSGVMRVTVFGGPPSMRLGP